MDHYKLGTKYIPAGVVVYILMGVMVDKVSEHLKYEVNQEVFFDTVDFALKYNYPIEEHEVQTEDGYILTIHRIPHGRNMQHGTKDRRVVFLQHGIMCSSDSWVYKGPQNDLAFMLADDGFDVWLGNSRGNHYSMQHINLTSDDRDYWYFSMHEMGYYDIPATVDYILDLTHQKNLSYIGYSMGATIFFVFGVSRPEYQHKINKMIALAPTTGVEVGETLILEYGIYVLLILVRILRLFNYFQLIPRTDFLAIIISQLCQTGSITENLCRFVVFEIAGESEVHFNKTLGPILFSHAPCGFGHLPLVHFHQMRLSGVFNNFDHGYRENLKRYKSSEPPRYNLSTINVPVYIYYGRSDKISPPKMVEAIVRELVNVYAIKEIKSFNHFDFLWGLGAPDLLFKDIIQDLRRR